jgi:hypothetical protein
MELLSLDFTGLLGLSYSSFYYQLYAYGECGGTIHQTKQKHGHMLGQTIHHKPWIYYI